MTLTQAVIAPLVILAGITQTNVGSRATVGLIFTPRRTTMWAGMALWAVAMLGLIAAGFGLLGVSPFRVHWRETAVVAVASSAVLLLVSRAAFARIVAVIDIIVLAAIFAAGPVVSPPAGPALHAFAIVALVYFTAALVLRPWYFTWGATADEWRTALPGDELLPEPALQLTRAITIDAPPSRVWPWLVQMGQDRGGLYS